MIRILLLLAIFFNAVGFISGIDTQPTFFVFGCLFLFFVKPHVDKSALLFFMLSLVLYFISMVVNHDELSVKFFLIYSVFIGSFFLVYIYSSIGVLDVNIKFLWVVVFVYSLVGFIQLFVPDFLSFLVTRGDDAILKLQTSGRGVRSLTGEPAHFGKVLSLCLILILFCYCKFNEVISRRKLIVYSLVIFVIIVFLSRSAYAITFNLLVIFSLLFFTNKRMFFSLVISFSAAFYLFYSLVLNFDSDIRFVVVFQSLFENPDYILSQGAVKRLLNIPMQLNNLSYFGIFGAADSTDAFNASIWTPFGELSYTAIGRGYGGYLELFLKFGLLSLPFYFVYFYMLFVISKYKCALDSGKTVRVGYFFSFVIFVLSIQDGTPVHPLMIFTFVWIFVKVREGNVKLVKC